MNTQSIETFDQTPRPVPGSVVPPLYFGGFAGPFGWFFFGFGMIFVWIFTINSDISDLWAFQGTKATAEGTVIRSEKTNFSVGGSGNSSSSGTPVYEIFYRFEDTNGNPMESSSYKTGWDPGAGTKVPVEFIATEPEKSRIVGTRRGVMAWYFGLIPVVFPLIGFCFIQSRFRRGRKAHRLLRHGRLGVGRMVDKKRTNTEINDQPVYKFTFEFQTDDGTPVQTTVKTHNTKAIEDEPEEFLLYDVMTPESAVLMDALPTKVTISDEGYIEPVGVRGFLALVIPIGAIAANVVAGSIVLG